MYLIDTSAWLKRAHRPVGERLSDLLAARRLAVAPITRLEALFGAQGPRWMERAHDLDALEQVAHPAEVFDAAMELQRSLSQAGLQGRKVPDLLVAVTAVAHDLPVLHYDGDYEHIASVLPEFAHSWVVPAGSLQPPRDLGGSQRTL